MNKEGIYAEGLDKRRDFAKLPERLRQDGFGQRHDNRGMI